MFCATVVLMLGCGTTNDTTPGAERERRPMSEQVMLINCPGQDGTSEGQLSYLSQWSVLREDGLCSAVSLSFY